MSYDERIHLVMHYLEAIDMAVFLCVHCGVHNKRVGHYLELAGDYANMLGYSVSNVMFDFNCRVAEMRKEREYQRLYNSESRCFSFFRWLKGRVFRK